MLVGDDKVSSRILEPDEISPAGYQVVRVPTEHQDPFRLDVDIALRDVAGVSTAASYSFFDPVTIRAAVDPTRESPFLVDQINTLTLGSGNKIQDYMDVRRICDIQRSSWMPLLDPGTPRYAHVDIGLTGERTGIAIGHAVPYEDGGIGVCYDFLIGIQGRTGAEVDLTAVVEWILYLREIGYNMSMVTYDSYQSRHSIQLLTTHKVVSGIQSVDINCYTVLKSMMATGRCEMYPYEPVVKELLELRRDTGPAENAGMIVDMDRPHHPPGGNDDVADAMAAVAMHVAGLSKIKASELGDEALVSTQPLIMIGNRGP